MINLFSSIDWGYKKLLPLFNWLVLSTLGMSIYKLKVWIRKQQIKLLASFFKHNVPNNLLFFNMVKVVKEIFTSKWDQIVGGFQKRKKINFVYTIGATDYMYIKFGGF